MQENSTKTWTRQDELQEQNDILKQENRVLEHGIGLTLHWIKRDYPFSELSKSEVISMLEKMLGLDIKTA